MKSRILIVAALPEGRRLLESMASVQNYCVETAEDCEAALVRLRPAGMPTIAALVVELPIADRGGMAALERLAGSVCAPPAIAVVRDMAAAVLALRAGAVDFVLAPPSPSRLRVALANAARIDRLEREVVRLGGGRRTARRHAGPGVADARQNAGETIGEAPAITDTSGRSRYGLARLVDERGELRSFEVLEEEVIRFAIGHCRGHMSEVARRLGIGRSTLYRKLKDYGIGSDQAVAV